MSNLKPVQNQAVGMFEEAGFKKAQIELYKNSFCKGATDEELYFFMTVCKQTGLDPVKKQIYCIKRWDNKLGKYVFTPQASIDGMRVVAERSGSYEGQEGPFWCGKDGKWVDVWTQSEPPYAAKVGVWKKNAKTPIWGVAKYDQYVQKFKNKAGQEYVSDFWVKMPDNQLAKCAESLALRKAFPNETNGIYTQEEMAQSTVEKIEQAPTQAAIPAAQDRPADINARFSDNGEVDKKTGEVIEPKPPALFDEDIPDFDSPPERSKEINKPDHWNAVIKTGTLAGKTLKQVFDEKGKDGMVSVYKKSLEKIANLPKEGKEIPAAVVEMMSNMEKCLKEVGVQ